MGALTWLYDYIFLVVWYFVEFAANIAVILYVAHTFGYWKPPVPKQDVPATFDKTLQDTKNIFGVVGDIAGQLKGAMQAVNTPPVSVEKMTRAEKIALLQQQAQAAQSKK